MSDEQRESTPDELHGWGPSLEHLGKRVEVARAMGGPEKLEKRRANGLLNARERIEQLLDPGSFREVGTLTATVVGEGERPAPADAFPAGFGRIEGRPVLVGAEDFTVMGGSIGLAAADKRYRLTQLAKQERVPLLFILEGAGHRMTNALKGHGRTPNDLQGLIDLSGIVPTACIVLGASAGHGALAAPMMDFAVMSEGAALFTAGPPLVEAATGEKIEKHDLGGPDVHVKRSGVVHNRAADDAAALAMARQYLHYFPSSAFEPPPRREAGGNTGERRLDEILALIPPDDRKPYKMKRVLECLVDEGTFFEVQPQFGTALITGLGFIGGEAVALVANEPMAKAGALDSDAGEKGARFIEVAGAFHLPVVFLADNPGVQAGSKAEREGALRAAARLFAAQRRLTTPKFHVTVRKAFGFGSSVMAMNPFDAQTFSVAFPGATLGAMPAASGGRAAKAGANEQEALDALQLGGPWSVASTLGFDEIIDPRELRNWVLDGLRITAARRAAVRAPVERGGYLP
ncbi:MAG: carboxyl transferase domain-containing protein [Myxococcota bacterium]|nr:carboxyl transferase domain-containing protein [Myxococcota bacterium]